MLRSRKPLRCWLLVWPPSIIWFKLHVNENGGSTTASVRDFIRMNPYELLGSQTSEDPRTS